MSDNPLIFKPGDPLYEEVKLLADMEALNARIEAQAADALAAKLDRDIMGLLPGDGQG